jgi:hypothetical protein
LLHIIMKRANKTSSWQAISGLKIKQNNYAQDDIKRGLASFYKLGLGYI